MDEKKYLKAIAKQLKCGASKRKELLKQIQSDLTVSIQNGKTFADAANEIGSPHDIAKEFNESACETDLKNYKRERTLKIAGIIVVIVLLLAIPSYWIYPKTSDIEKSGRFSGQEISEQAKVVIRYINTDDFEALKPLMTAQMQKVMTREVINDAKNALSDDFGELLSWGNEYMVELSQMGQYFAVMEITVSYENTSATYRLTFDENMLLAGLYIR